MKLTSYYKFKIILLAICISTYVLCFTTEFENKLNEKLNSFVTFMKGKKAQLGHLNGLYKSSDQTAEMKSSGLNSKSLENKKASATPITPQELNTINPEILLSGKKDFKTKNDFLENQNAAEIDTKIGNGPIFASGWIKYFKYQTTTQNKMGNQNKNPRSFIVNGQYNEQLKLLKNPNLEEKSNDGLNDSYTNIRTRFSFYGVLLKNSLNILSSRLGQTSKTYDTINIANLGKIQEVGGFPKGGGIEDFGNFSEGFCFKLNLIVKSAQTYVICCDEKKTKISLMNYIKKMKIQIQRDNGEYLTPNRKENDEEMSVAGMFNINKVNMGPTSKESSNGKLKVNFNSKEKMTDGYWIVLQTWSQCTLKCGGGKSFLQRMCVPPKNGGKPCIGESIISKDCNTKPCPKVIKTQEMLKSQNSNNTQTLKPIIKIMPFSNKPQRYTKCVIKEGDLLYIKNIDEEDKKQNEVMKLTDMSTIKIPVKAIMNNRTMTLFSGEDYDTHVMTFLLKNTRFAKDAKNEECFIITEDTEKQAILCPLLNSKKIIEEWDYDFHLFKYQCNYNRPEHVIDEFQKKLNEKMKDVKKSLLTEEQEKLRQNSLNFEETKMENSIKSTNKVALQAIQKEVNLEELIKQEESEREKKEEQLMLKKIDDEKKKSECLMKALKEKELENQYNVKQRETADAIKNIKKAALQEVQIRRTKLKKIIEEMRKKQKRKTNDLSQRLLSIRYEMAKQMGKAYKKGNAMNCVNIISGNNEKKEMRKQFCTANFSEDFLGFQNCKDSDDFCHLCCDVEFGEFYVGEREDCYKKTCLSPTLPITPKENGRWVWQNEIASE